MTPEATEQLLKNAASLEEYFDAIALLHDVVTRMVPGQGGPRFTVADADQRLSEISNSLRATVGAAVADTVEDNRATVMAALAKPSDEDEARSLVETIVAEQRTFRRAARVKDSREVFFRAHYRSLIKIPMYLGATNEEAQDAVSGALVDAMHRWDQLRNPLAWVSRAAANNYFMEKTRGLHRVRNRLVEKGEGTAEIGDDQQISLWEDRQWVAQMLVSLPPKQREAMSLVIEDLSPTEIAELLGRTPGAIRQNLLEARKRLQRRIQNERAGEQQPDSAREFIHQDADVETLETTLREFFYLVDTIVAVQPIPQDLVASR
jgi:RNA polymerase sigma-70 factor (ECF subfamily)